MMNIASHDKDSDRQWTPDRIQKRIVELGDWFHNIQLQGVATAPNHFLGDYPSLKWRRFEHAIPRDLRGKTVLDIGCNAGFYSLEMKRRGADRVVGVDSDQRYLDQARFAADVAGLEIEWRPLSVYEIEDLHEQFDIVLFMGVLYHLRHPLLALDLIRRHVARDLIVVQSMLRGSKDARSIADDYPISETQVFEHPGFPKMFFIEKKYSADPTNWWIPNAACLEAMLRSAGFEILEHPEEEVFIAKASEIPQAIKPELVTSVRLAQSTNPSSTGAQHD
jgi:tRNA (mo5U34)-methyltransferase